MVFARAVSVAGLPSNGTTMMVVRAASSLQEPRMRLQETRLAWRFAPIDCLTVCRNRLETAV